MILEKAMTIRDMAFYSRPEHYEKLVSEEIVPVLLDVATFVDEFTALDDGQQATELVSVADALNEFKATIEAQQRQIDTMTEKQAATEKRLTSLQKPATRKQTAGVA